MQVAVAEHHEVVHKVLVVLAEAELLLLQVVHQVELQILVAVVVEEAWVLHLVEMAELVL